MRCNLQPPTRSLKEANTFTIENFPPTTGQISKDHKTITEAFLTPGIEIVTAQNGTITHRICTNSRVLIKMDAD
jgi:hypothetical protein